MNSCSYPVSILVAAAVAGSAAGGELFVVNPLPAAHSMDAATDTTITVFFNQPVDITTIDGESFRAFGRWSGPVEGTFDFKNADKMVSLVPDQPLAAGETVMVVLADTIAAADGSPLREAGYSYQFGTAACPTVMTFTQIDVLTTNGKGESSRPYGGIATDLNNDGFLDMTIVNEDTADLRVFMNQADGRGAFDPFNEPTYAVGIQASPSEPADFNNDGNADICVANITPDTISVLLGNGDGTYGPHQLIEVGNAPRGIAVLDVDGDGDVDIANTNSGDSNVSILLNDGSGTFGKPTFFEGGGATEWALAAADMNDDGILDLVIGARGSQQIIVQTGNGDGTFSLASTQAAGGAVWMLNCGDVNGDGNADVALANSTSNNGSILLGDGAGNLAAPDTQATDPFPLATDLADMDGDGDLDWITSSFNGDWALYTNDGDGNFAFDREFNAPANASCSLPFDFDNDGDLDLGLIDEIADIVVMMRNDSDAATGDVNLDGTVDVDDLVQVILDWGECAVACCPADLDGDGDVDVDDLVTVILNWS